MLIPGATLSLQIVWSFANVMNGLMAFPNLIGIFGLSSIIAAETREFEKLLKFEQKQQA
jgi:AGCS family alanine or glycine:cation symporter